MLADFCIFIARHYLFREELLRARGEIFVATDRHFLVQPLALRTHIRKQVFAHNQRVCRVASAGLTFKDLGEGARSGNAATVATLQLASSHAGGASGLAFRHRHHAAFRRARARSCHTQLTLSACRPHWREVVLSSSCASERVRRSPQCGGSRDCQAPSQWRRALPCWANVTVHRLASHARCHILRQESSR